MYEENVVAGLPDRKIAKEVLDALVKQNICGKKKKEHGWKYFLNMDRYDKIKEIIKESGSGSIIPILLML
jgi:ethanolamine utilization protein EutQ (cupin superfamily)